MASTLSPDQQELTFFSFPIEKREETAELNPVDGTPDILIWGKATDGTVDGDNEIVDPEWSAKALQEWAAKGNVRMSHDPRRPVGRGQDVQITTDGHWVKSLIADPLAKHFIRIGALNDYSVGISNPDFRYGDRSLDPQGKALRVITGRSDGSSRIAELSIVDRGSNFNSEFQVVRKSAGEGAGFIGKMVGPDEETALARALIAEAADADLIKTVNVDIPKDVSVSFSPADLKKLLEHRREAEARQKAAAAADAPKGELSAADRAKLPASSFAFVDSKGDGHLPVHDEGHVRSALGRFGQQQFPDSKSKRRAARKIVSRAHGMGIDVDPASDVARAAGKLAEADSLKAAGAKCGLCKGKGKIRGGKLECPRCHGDGMIGMGEPDEHGDDQDAGKDAAAEVTKGGARDCPKCGKGHDADSPSKFCADCGHKLPAMSAKDAEPDLAKDAGGDDDAQADSQAPDSGGTGEDGPADSGADDGDDDDDDCGKTAEPDAGKAAAALVVTAKPKIPCPKCGKGVKAKMPFCGKCGAAMKTEKAGKPTPDGGAVGEHLDPVPAHREPDGPAIESLEHDAGLPTDPDSRYVKAASARIGALGVPYPLGALHDRLCPAYAPGMAAKAHPDYDLADVDLADWAAKAMEAATQPGDWLQDATRAQALWQHAATVKSLPPGDAAEIAAEAHKAFADANPGPGTFPTPAELTPQRFRRPYITAGHAAPSPQQDGPNTAAIPAAGGITATDYTRGYLDAGHADDSPQNKADGGAPPMPGASSSGRTFYRNASRDNAKAAMQAMHDHIAQTFPDLCPMHSDPNADPMPKPNPLPRPAGSTKADEGAPAAKTAKPAKEKRDKTAPGDAGLMTREEAIAWLASEPEILAKAAGAGASAPDVVKAAVADVMSPLLAELAATRAQLDTQAETLEAQGKALRKSHKILDAIAAQPDQNGPYRGAPLQQFTAEKAMAPTTLSPAQAAEQSQRMVYEELHRTWRESPDATARLAAEDAMAKMRGIPSGGMIRA